jgi:FlaA1/EpsC-like NDP-sugar epimerase
VRQSLENDARKYFCVSTDKAANPVNMMGASKRIMEMYLMRDGAHLPISTARFANVAFSDGSLLHGFNQRLLKRQPIVAPSDVKRYFVTPQESGELCLMSCLFGENRDIFFPKPSTELQLITFAEIATRFIRSMGYEPYACSDEDEARELVKTLPEKKQWPCLFGISDTTGEKDFEEFFTENEAVDFSRFVNLGIVQNSAPVDTALLDHFSHTIQSLKQQGQWNRQDLVALFYELLPDFQHKETGKYLDAKM